MLSCPPTGTKKRTFKLTTTKISTSHTETGSLEVVDEPTPKRDATQSEIQEILRKRREMLNRVRADLDRVGRIQDEFEKEKSRERPRSEG